TVLLYLVSLRSATTRCSRLSLHDALPISRGGRLHAGADAAGGLDDVARSDAELAFVEWSCATSRRWTSSRGAATTHSRSTRRGRSEEHTSELQSRVDLVCRLLLERITQII